jgi:hypothetical protein
VRLFDFSGKFYGDWGRVRSMKDRVEIRGFLCAVRKKRLEELEESFWRTDECRRLSRIEDCLFERIKQTLPEELHRDLVRYSDTLTSIMCLQEDFFYRNGFFDGAEVARCMRSKG